MTIVQRWRDGTQFKENTMQHLNPEKLHVTFSDGITNEGPLTPRCYTLTHSDTTGELFLTIGKAYDQKQISGWYTRLMRDEVLASWMQDQDGSSLHVYVHVSGGLIFGTAGYRDRILRHHMPQVLEAIRFGDQNLFETNPELDQTPIVVHFQASQPRYNQAESWGLMADYR
jgi:hypothetical protein